MCDTLPCGQPADAAGAAGAYASGLMPHVAQVSIHFVEFVVNGFLALDVLALRLFDKLARRLLSLVVRVMAATEQKLAAGRRVGADAPAAPLMAVVLAV